jgi:uncharacterized membrane protein
VIFLGEVWLAQNIFGTALVILGVIVLSFSNPTAKEWRKQDVIYPILAALAFGVSTVLRKTGLMTVQVPLLAAAVTLGSALVTLLAIVRWRGGVQVLRFQRASSAWLFGAALVNSAAILSFFSALNAGNIVRVEPLVACNPLLTLVWASIFLKQIESLTGRVVAGSLLTVAGTMLVVTSK